MGGGSDGVLTTRPCFPLPPPPPLSASTGVAMDSTGAFGTTSPTMGLGLGLSPPPNGLGGLSVETFNSSGLAGLAGGGFGALNASALAAAGVGAGGVFPTAPGATTLAAAPHAMFTGVPGIAPPLLAEPVIKQERMSPAAIPTVVRRRRTGGGGRALAPRWKWGPSGSVSWAVALPSLRIGGGLPRHLSFGVTCPPPPPPPRPPPHTPSPACTYRHGVRFLGRAPVGTCVASRKQGG